MPTFRDSLPSIAQSESLTRVRVHRGLRHKAGAFSSVAEAADPDLKPLNVFPPKTL